ncbi:beta-N-acetylhexosaminidase [Parabacteroides sp. OttesenSCG-928-K15]|nr:beta-N-acetylhexosaminidase [Parabacteroides sp. OttesenSCG-928-K15]
MKRTLFFFLMVCTICPLYGQIVIPSASEMITGNGYCRIGKQLTLSVPEEGAAYIEQLKDEAARYSLSLTYTKAEKAIVRFLFDTSIASEGYRLTVTPKYIEVKACDEAGFFYAIQTLAQLMEKSGRGVAVPCLQITDAPRHGYRCFMLDSGRQFQQLSTVKKYIDMAAMLKMNYFHWHLTEGLGWRMEIKKYPLLTEVGAFVGRAAEQQGFYTQEDMKEIIRYAAERYITVIPEIDMPGHAEAALAAYPQLGCFNEKIEVPETGFTHHIMCAGKDSTIQFLRDVLDEVCDLFPSPYIHLGGDEAPKKNWDNCPHCRKRIEEKGLKNSHDLQIWFAAEMAQYLKEKGRSAIFWEDVIYHEGYALPDNVVIQWWNYRGHGEDGLTKSLQRNHRVIAGTNYYSYLNFPVTPWSGYTKERTFDMRDIYLKNPSARRFDNPLVLGMNTCLWTDYNVTEAMIDKRLFPRVFAVAQQMWYSGEKEISFEDFYAFIKKKQFWFEAKGYEFGPALKQEVPEDYNWE